VILADARDSPVRLLIVDDDQVLSAMLKEYLESEDCVVSLARDGDEALAMLQASSFDLLVLDVMMPGRTGIEILGHLRPKSRIPVIMLTARNDDLDRIIGLDLGADDYLPKPCNPRELRARIRAVLRRTLPGKTSAETEIRIGDIRMIPGRREVLVYDPGHPESHRIVPLTQTEFDLLHLLLEHAGSLVRKPEISSKVLGKPLSQWDRSIDMHISNLRKKLGRHHHGKERIRTLRGIGYIYQKP